MYSDVIALVGAAKGLAIPAAAPRALVPRLLTATPATAATNQPGPLLTTPGEPYCDRKEFSNRYLPPFLSPSGLRFSLSFSSFNISFWPFLPAQRGLIYGWNGYWVDVYINRVL